jgi:hypothetical protein
MSDKQALSMAYAKLCAELGDATFRRDLEQLKIDKTLRNLHKLNELAGKAQEPKQEAPKTEPKSEQG